MSWQIKLWHAKKYQQLKQISKWIQDTTLSRDITMTYKYTKLYWASHSYMYRSYWIFVQLSVVQLVQWQGEEGKKKGEVLPDMLFAQKNVTKCVLCSIVEDKIKRSRQPTPCSDAHGERDFGWARRPSLSELSPDHRAVCSRYEDFFPFHSVLNRCMTGNPQDRDVQAIIYIY